MGTARISGLTLLLIGSTAAWFLQTTTPKQTRCDAATVDKLKQDVAANIECCTQNTDRLGEHSARLKENSDGLKVNMKETSEVREELTLLEEKFKNEMKTHQEELKIHTNEKMQNLNEELKSLRKENKILKDALTETNHCAFKESKKIVDCQALKEEQPDAGSGVYQICPGGGTEPVRVYCDMDTRGGGWTVLLTRFDGSVSFDRNWEAMKHLVGKLTGEFWLGLEDVHRLTYSGRYSLLAELDSGTQKKIAFYRTFALDSEANKYQLTVTGYNSRLSTAGDSMLFHNGMYFSTFERDNDQHASNCASGEQAPNWYKNCFRVAPFGQYRYRPGSVYTKWQAMMWYGFENRVRDLRAMSFKVRRKLL